MKAAVLVLILALLACGRSEAKPEPPDPHFGRACLLVNQNDRKSDVAVFPDLGMLALAVNARDLGDDIGFRQALATAHVVKGSTPCTCGHVRRHEINKWRARQVALADGRVGWVRVEWAEVQ